MTGARMRLFALAAAALTAAAAPVTWAVKAQAETPERVVVTASDARAARGTIVSAEAVAGMTRDEVVQYLAQAGADTAGARHGLDAYRIVYRTIAPDKRPTTAGGLVVLPRDGSRDLRVVAYEHGTMISKAQAPSVQPQQRADAFLFGSAGYAAVAPDYLGLGLGPGRHPYGDVSSEVTASADLLRAARTFAAKQQRRLRSRVLVSGFSQGGAAAMGLARALQRGQVPYYRLAAVAPISGAYDVQNAEIPAALSGDSLDPRRATLYFAYSLTALNRIHHFYEQPSEVFNEPYAGIVEDLFDGEHTDRDVAMALPATPQELLTPRFIAWASEPTGNLLNALRSNDTTCTDWKPRVPVRLYAATGDKDVSILNAKHCVAALRANGVEAPLTDFGDVPHGASKRAALPEILTWFDGLKP
ncbi:alpha/beta hydrolase family protein [Actinomadura syzygii]|nr:alpha/beta fold hydrolase [Actinomadura syzygii]